MIGASIVTLALISYSIGIITEQRKKKLTNKVLWFLSIGLLLDMSATTCMIIGSSNTPFTFHGFIGYSGLIAMMIDLTLIWRLYIRNGINSEVSKGVHLYSRFAYIWWVIVYITGTLLIMVK